MAELQIHKRDYTQVRVVETPAWEELHLEDETIIVAIEQFAYTANNITYAVAGDRFGYWQFFPPYGEDTQEWGITPVWGFASIVATKNKALPVGERLYGYFPPAHYLKMLPVKISQTNFIDGVSHRANLPVIYNSYERVKTNNYYNSEDDFARMLFGPLHLTSFFIKDFLEESHWQSSNQVIILSASSKTSLGLAFAITEAVNRPRIVGLTSKKHIEPLSKLELYDEIYSYEDLASISTDTSTLVDMSGRFDVVNALSELLKENLQLLIRVGRTHWKTQPPKVGVEKEKSMLFFAPTVARKRFKEWGPEKFEEITASFIKRSAAKMTTWLQYKEIKGLEAMSQIHQPMADGAIPSDQGIIVTISHPL